VRAQTTLPALGVALVLLTAVTGLALAMGDAAISDADRTPDERRTAAAVADALVAAGSPVSARENVLDRSRLNSFDGAALTATAPPADEHATRVTLDGAVVASDGAVDGGTTIRRLVLVETMTRETVEPSETSVTLPRRTPQATIRLDPPNGSAVWTVTAGDRVVLHDDSGLHGTFTVALDPHETTQLRFQSAGGFTKGNITVSYDAPRTTKATLAVTVDG